MKQHCPELYQQTCERLQHLLREASALPPVPNYLTSPGPDLERYRETMDRYRELDQEMNALAMTTVPSEISVILMKMRQEFYRITLTIH